MGTDLYPSEVPNELKNVSSVERAGKARKANLLCSEGVGPEAIACILAVLTQAGRQSPDSSGPLFIRQVRVMTELSSWSLERR